VKSYYYDRESNSTADLCDYYGHGMILTRINVPIASRGKGVGSRLLDSILADADKDNITLFLEISPSNGLSYEQLEKWYLRKGFSPWNGVYRRLPGARISTRVDRDHDEGLELNS